MLKISTKIPTDYHRQQILNRVKTIVAEEINRQIPNLALVSAPLTIGTGGAKIFTTPSSEVRLPNTASQRRLLSRTLNSILVQSLTLY